MTVMDISNKSGEKKGEGGNMAYPIVISQDGDEAEVGEVIKEFLDMFAKVGVPFAAAFA